MDYAVHVTRPGPLPWSMLRSEAVRTAEQGLSPLLWLSLSRGSGQAGSWSP